MNERPWFLWDLPVSDSEFRERLRCRDADVRAQWQGRLLREARFSDVWRYVTLDDVLENWPRIRRHLGRSRAFWEYTLDAWRRRGFVG
jgi:hypothetical protein